MVDSLCHLFSRNKSDHIKTSPILYVKKLVILAAKNKFDLAVSTKKIIRQHLDALTKGYSKSSIGLYERINNLKNDESVSIRKIREHIEELKQDLSGQQAHELTDEQKHLIYLIWGTYNAFSMLVRLNRLYRDESEPTQFLLTLYQYLLLTNAFSEREGQLQNQREKDVFHKFLALAKKDKLTKKLAFQPDEVKSMVHFYCELERFMLNNPQQKYSSLPILESSFEPKLSNIL